MKRAIHIGLRLVSVAAKLAVLVLLAASLHHLVPFLSGWWSGLVWLLMAYPIAFLAKVIYLYPFSVSRLRAVVRLSTSGLEIQEWICRYDRRLGRSGPTRNLSGPSWEASITDSARQEARPAGVLLGLASALICLRGPLPDSLFLRLVLAVAVLWLCVLELRAISAVIASCHRRLVKEIGFSDHPACLEVLASWDRHHEAENLGTGLRTPGMPTDVALSLGKLFSQFNTGKGEWRQ